ncbi:MAG: PAS domain S-box protein [Deltaproteobacteria bacterium]|nr:PAS domain S-box protein [Deltaproteobacteria bacterium]
MSDNYEFLPAEKQKRDGIHPAMVVMSQRLEDMIRFLSAVSALTAIPIRAASLLEAAEAVLTTLVLYLDDVQGSSIMLFDREAGLLQLLAARGPADLLGEESGPYNKELTFRPGEGIAGMVFQTGLPAFLENGAEQVIQPIQVLTQPTSLACLPLSIMDSDLGILNVSFLEPQRFDQYQRQNLSLLSGAMANIIQAFILKEELDRQSAKLQEQLIETHKEIQKRRQAEAALRQAHNQLEQRVLERTAELTRVNQELYSEIKERQRSEEARRESETRYLALFDRSLDGVYLHDFKGRFLDANPAMVRLLGYSLEEILRVQYADLIDESQIPTVRASIEELLETGTQREPTIYKIKRKSGDYVWVETMASVIYQDGEAQAIQGIARDITIRKKVEEELRRANDEAEAAARAKSEFIANITHELRTPLNPIIGMTDLVLQTELTPSQRSFLLDVKESGRNLLNLVDDLIELSRIEACDYQLLNEPLSIEVILDAAIRSVKDEATRKNLLLYYEISPEIPKLLMGDVKLVSTILSKILENSVKFTPAGWVKAAVSLDKERATPNWIRLTISDSGVGIPANYLPILFRDFSQADGSASRQYQGLGLGLTMARRLVLLAGGEIWAESTEGLGSIFCISLPFQPVKNDMLSWSGSTS